MQLILDIIDQISLILLCQPLGIGYQPQFVLLIPDFEFSRIKRLSATLFKDITDICRLDTTHQFIIAIGQGIQFLLLTMIGRHLRLTLQDAQSLNIEIMRMKCKSRNNIIRIRITPVM